MIIYFKGDKAELTGKVVEIYGGKFREVRLLEGHLKDELRLIKYKEIVEE